MFSKNNFYLSGFLVLALLFSGVGCSELFEVRKPKKEPIVLETKTSCLDQITPTMEAFLDNKASEAQIHSGFACVREVISQFEEHTVGEQKEGYTTSELKTLVESKKFINRSVPAPLFDLFMDLKVFMVGGEQKILLRTELKELAKRTLTIEKFATQVQSSLSLFYADKKIDLFSKTEEDSFIAKQMAIENLVNYLVVESPVNPKAFSIEKMLLLAESVLNFLKTSKDKSVVSKYLPLVRSVSQVLFSKEYLTVGSAASWKYLASLVRPGLDLTFRYKYLVVDRKWDNIPALKKMDDLFVRTLKTVRYVFSQRNQEISFSQLDALIVELCEIGLFPDYLTASVLQSTYQRAVIRLLDLRPIAEKDKANALTLEHLKVFEREFLVWSEIQNWLNVQYDGKQKFQAQTGVAGTWKKASREFKLSNPLVENYSLFEQDEIMKGIYSFSDVIDKEKTLPWTADKKISIGLESNKDWNWGSLSVANILRSIIRLGYTGYAEDPIRSAKKSGLTMQEVENIYTEMRPLGLAVGMMDPRSSKSGERTFKEGNLFTWSANGNLYLEPMEAIELVSLLYSGGFAITKQILNHPEIKACEGSDIDLFGHKYLKKDCYHQAFQKNVATFFSSRPNMLNHFKISGDESLKVYFERFSILGRNEFSKPGFVETSDIRTSVMILTYIEVLFNTYDLNLSNGIDQNEALLAFPRFKDLLIERMPALPKWVPLLKKDDLAPAAFLLILFEGEKPEGAKVLGTYLEGRNFEGEMNRTDALRVFNVLTSR